MEMYITLYEDEEGTAVIAQRNAVQIAKELGFREMPLRGLRVEDYTYRELKNRIYGIITGIKTLSEQTCNYLASFLSKQSLCYF